MNGLLLLVGLIPLIAFSIVTIAKKKSLLVPIISLTCSVAVVISGFVFFPSKIDPSTTITGQLRYLANINMLSGNYEKAEDYLDDLYKIQGDSVATLQAYMRLNLLKGDIAKSAMYAKSLSVLPDNTKNLSALESSFIGKIADGSFRSPADLEADQSAYMSIVATGGNPADYGIANVTDADIENAKKELDEIENQIKESVNGDIKSYTSGNKAASALQKAISASGKLNTATSSDFNSNEEYNSFVKSQLTTLSSLVSSNPEVFQYAEVADVYLDKLLDLSAYNKLITYAFETNNSKALLSVSVLLDNETITEKDIPSKYLSNVDGAKKVLEKCKDIYKELSSSNMSNTEKEGLQRLMAAISTKINQPVISELEQRINPEAVENKNKSEYYIQDSVLNSLLNDQNAAYSDLDNAIKYSPYSDNSLLKDSLTNIDATINNKNTTSEIKNTTYYFKSAYQSTLPDNLADSPIPEAFENNGTAYTNEKRAMINIGIIDSSKFPIINARISSSGVELNDKGKLFISDCGIEITDYTIKKITYSGAKVALVCDTSGSMSGSMNQLRSAVSSYIKTMLPNEKVALIDFSGSVKGNTGFTANKDVLSTSANALSSGGGTNIASGVYAALDSFEESGSTSDTLNFIIVMTDGEDSSFYGDSEFNALRKRCIANNVILYTVGIGSVNPDYLQKIANYGGGNFVYSSSEAALAEMYSLLHKQLDNNYLLTYEAKDQTKQTDRELIVQHKTENYSSSRTYDILLPDSDSNNQNDENNASADKLVNDSDGDVTVSTLGLRKIVKGENEAVKFTVIGRNLKKEGTTFSVSVSNSKDSYHNLKYTIDSETKMTVELPANTNFGTYTVNVVVNSSTFKLEGLQINDGSTGNVVAFGDYIFTADKVVESNYETILSGNVCMNDFLYFKGDVTLHGSLENLSITLRENSGSYVSYNNHLPGLLGSFFENIIELPAIIDLTLYKEDDTFAKYSAYGNSAFYAAVVLPNPYLELHPAYLKLSVDKAGFDFPVIGEVLDEGLENVYGKAPNEIGFTVSQKRVGLVLKVEAEDYLPDKFKLGIAKFAPDKITVEIDTLNHDYKVGMETEIEKVPVLKDTTFSFEIGFKNGDLNNIDLGADFKIPIVKTPPVNIRDFHIGVDDLANDAKADGFKSRLLASTFYGQCKIDFFNLNDLIPGLKAIFDDKSDIAILSIDDIKLAVRIKNFNITVSAEAKFLDWVSLGKVEFGIGNYDFECHLLNIDASAKGIYGKATKGFNLDITKDFKISSSAMARVDISNKFSGVQLNGDVNYYLKFFGKHEGALDGNAIIGIHGSGMNQFTILIKGKDKKDKDTIGVRLTFTKGDWFPSVDFY